MKVKVRGLAIIKLYDMVGLKGLGLSEFLVPGQVERNRNFDFLQQNFGFIAAMLRISNCNTRHICILNTQLETVI